MRKTTAIITLAVVATITGSFAQQATPGGFRNIPFGTSKAVVKELLIATYDMKPKFPVAESPLGSEDGPGLNSISHGLILTDYEVGERTYDVRLFFNANQRFCGFLLEGRMYSRHEARKELIEDFAFIAEVFNRKYGRPGNKILVRVDDVVYNDETCVCMRNDDQYCVMSGVVTRKSGRRTKYVPFAGICSKQLKHAQPVAHAERAGEGDVTEQIKYHLAVQRTTAVQQAMVAF